MLCVQGQSGGKRGIEIWISGEGRGVGKRVKGGGCESSWRWVTGSRRSLVRIGMVMIEKKAGMKRDRCHVSSYDT